MAARTTDDELEIVGAVIVGDFLVRLDVAHRADKHAPAIGVSFRIRIAGMVGVARDIAARRTVNGDARIDFVKVAIAASLEPSGLLGADARPLVLGDSLALLDGPDGE